MRKKYNAEADKLKNIITFQACTYVSLKNVRTLYCKLIESGILIDERKVMPASEVV